MSVFLTSEILDKYCLHNGLGEVGALNKKTYVKLRSGQRPNLGTLITLLNHFGNCLLNGLKTFNVTNSSRTSLHDHENIKW
jgi:hypothetical protein